MAVLTATAGSALLVTAMPAHADTARIREFDLSAPNFNDPGDITRGSDGNLWFTEPSSNKIGRLTPAGVITEFNVPDSPTAITLGSDGNVWFIEYNLDRLGRMTPSGVFTEFSPPSFVAGGNQPYQGIATGPDGNVWYAGVTNQGTAVIGRITPGGTATEFPVPFLPTAITAGPDGNIWFGLQGAEAVGRISVTGTNYTQFPLPPSGTFLNHGVVNAITAGPDGNVWYTNSDNRLGRITQDGTITEFPIPASGSQPQDITTGPDGHLWFTELVGNRIARATVTGAIQELLLPHHDSDPMSITAGPAHKVWFTEPKNNAQTGRIGSIDPRTVQPAPGPCMTMTRSTTLTQDVGPCAGDGIVVKANDITLDLNGHKVFAGPGRRIGDFAGIHLSGVSGVSVKNGSVTGFDAGVFVDGGSTNSITHLDVQHNLGATDAASNLGDGIVVFHSAGNVIANNEVAHNGVFDGIGVLGLGSNNNYIHNNFVHDNTDSNLGSQSDGGGGTGIVVDAFLEIEDPNRGASLTANNIIANTVRDNVSSGISSISNDAARVQDNVVTHNGFRPDGSAGNFPGNGIGIQANQGATPLTQDLVTGNRVIRNFNAGIQVFVADGNQVTQNRATGNNVGIENLFSHSNRYINNVATGDLLDLHDLNPGETDPCDSNVWRGNTYTTADPACTTIGGTQVGTPAAPRLPLVSPSKPKRPPIRLRRSSEAST